MLALTQDIAAVSLDAAGIVALADLSTIQQRTVLTGTANLLDSLVLCPGIHMQQKSSNLNRGEYPACAAMMTGHVFRIENPATVYYLQRVGKTVRLTTISVSGSLRSDGKLPRHRVINALFTLQNATLGSSLAYAIAMLGTIVVTILVGLSRDWWGLAVVFLLMLARLGNVIIIRRRSNAEDKWFGAKEQGVMGDLLMLLSQDQWIRMKGTVDDLKRATSGEWLRSETFPESWVTAFATLVVYVAAALASNLKILSKILLVVLLIGSAGLLAVTNVMTRELHMHGTILSVESTSER